MTEEQSTPEEKVLKGQAAYDLYKKGKEAWNKWAEDHPGWVVDFDDWVFSEANEVDFSSFRFPGNVSFNKVKFGEGDVDFGDATFGEGNVDFRRAKFGEGDVHFTRATFGKGDVDFDDARFGKGIVDFSDARFGKGNVNFRLSKFGEGNVYFTNATFDEGNVSFSHARFGKGFVVFSHTRFGVGNVSFGHTRFVEGDVSFVGATFGEGNVDFGMARFGVGYVSFGGATFGKGDVFFGYGTFGEGNVYFNGATFEGTSIFGYLDGFKFESAVLDRADLRKAEGFNLDDNSIRGTRFSPRSSDSYSVLRRQYTGVMFSLILLFTFLAVMPFAFKAITWSMVGQLEESILQPVLQQEESILRSVQQLEESILGQALELEEPILSTIDPDIESLLTRETQSVRTYQIAIGWTEEKRWLAVLIASLILVYNVVRGWVTFNISEIREAEERSQHAPAWEDYKLYHYVHKYFLRWFLWIIGLITAYRVIEIMLQPVVIPI